MGALIFFVFQNLGRANHLARAIRERRPPVRWECRGCQLQLFLDLRPVRGSKVFTTSPVAGLVVAIAMLVSSLPCLVATVQSSTPQPAGLAASCSAVGPQYHLTSRPRQGYTFKTPGLFSQIETGREISGRKTSFHPLSRIWRSLMHSPSNGIRVLGIVCLVLAVSVPMFPKPPRAAFWGPLAISPAPMWREPQ